MDPVIFISNTPVIQDRMPLWSLLLLPAVELHGLGVYCCKAWWWAALDNTVAVDPSYWHSSQTVNTCRSILDNTNSGCWSDLLVRDLCQTCQRHTANICHFLDVRRILHQPTLLIRCLLPQVLCQHTQFKRWVHRFPCITSPDAFGASDILSLMNNKNLLWTIHINKQKQKQSQYVKGYMILRVYRRACGTVTSTVKWLISKCHIHIC